MNGNNKLSLREIAETPRPVSAPRATEKAGGFSYLALVCAALLAGAVVCASAFISFAQRNRPLPIHVNPHMLQAPIHAESNLVLVPVFVYDKRRLNNPPSSQCVSDAEMTIKVLLPSEPFLPKDCYEAEVLSLTAKDFHLFQGGAEQKVQSVMGASWRITVRDNMGRHREFTESPAGKWSTADLSQLYWAASDAHFYVLAYVPPGAETGGCQPIEVKVDRRYALVRARREWCSGQSATDPLNGTPLGKRMERGLDSSRSGRIALALQAGFFYTNPERARVDIALKFPWKKLSRRWEDGNLHALIGVTGVAYRKDGALAARFSDLGCCSPNFPNYFKGHFKLGLSDGALLPTRYETQIDLPPGEYSLRVVLSDDKRFGRAEVPLDIPAYDGKHLGISSVMVCKRFRPAHAAAVENAAAHFAPQYLPLVSEGIQFTPAGDTGFKKGEPLISYSEVYEPLLAKQPKTEVEVLIRIVKATTGQVMEDFPPVNAAPYVKPGSTAIPIARKIPFGELSVGDYRLEVRASDSAGQTTPWHTADFTIEKGRWKEEPLLPEGAPVPVWPR